MAIELEKASQINPQINYIIVSLNPQMPQISTFDENINSEFVINTNAKCNILNSQYNISKEYKFKSTNKEELEINKNNKHQKKKISNPDLHAAEISSIDMSLSCESQILERKDLLIPNLKSKRRSIVGGVLGRKISNASSKIDTRRVSVSIKRTVLINEENESTNRPNKQKGSLEN